VVKAEQQVVISRPVEDVFAFTAGNYFANCAQWSADVVEIQPTSQGPMGVGATAREVRKIQGKPVEHTTEITEYQPNSRMSFVSRSADQKANGVLDFDAADGGTRVKFSLEVEGGFPKLAAPLVGRTMKKSLETDLNNLKAALNG
jgi:uncharacterized membrane protein